MTSTKKIRFKNGPLPTERFWNMAEIDGDTAEITMYGDVVSAQPIDWWTGEPEPGQYITPEGFAEAVGAALVGMAGDAVFIRTHENRIVVIGVFIQQLLSCKVRHNAPVDIPVLDQIGIDPAHIGIGRRKDKGLRRLLYPFLGRGINRSQLASQKHGHRLRIAEVIKPLHEADGVAAPLLGMIVPLVAADGDTILIRREEKQRGQITA